MTGPRLCRVAAGVQLDAMTTGLARACRSVITRSPGNRARLERRAAADRGLLRSMVIAGGLERMTFEVLRVLRDRHAGARIVNDWENFRITPLAEASGASWSVGPYGTC